MWLFLSCKSNDGYLDTERDIISWSYMIWYSVYLISNYLPLLNPPYNSLALPTVTRDINLDWGSQETCNYWMPQLLLSFWTWFQTDICELLKLNHGKSVVEGRVYCRGHYCTHGVSWGQVGYSPNVVLTWLFLIFSCLCTFYVIPNDVLPPLSHLLQ